MYRTNFTRALWADKHREVRPPAENTRHHRPVTTVKIEHADTLHAR